MILKNDKLYCFGGKKKNFNLFLNNYEIFDLNSSSSSLSSSSSSSENIKDDINNIENEIISKKKPMNFIHPISGNSNLLISFDDEFEIYFFISLMNHKINLVQNGKKKKKINYFFTILFMK